MSLPWRHTPHIHRIRVEKKRTNQIEWGRVMIKRSISDSSCVAFIEREFTTAIICIPGILSRILEYFFARSKSAISRSFGSDFTHMKVLKDVFLEGIFYPFARFLMASIVRFSSESEGFMSATTFSTWVLSYHIWTSDEMRVISVVIRFPLGDCFFEKSIDPLRSTMIFCAVFLPIHGTLDRSLSSSSSIARIIVSRPRPRIESAVFPPTPFTFKSSRKRDRSSWLSNPKRSSLISVLWWWIQVFIFVSKVQKERTFGDTRISSDIPVPVIVRVSVFPSRAMRFPERCQNMIAFYEKPLQLQIFSMKTPRRHISIDIFVSVVDNFWDIGFLTELLMALTKTKTNEYRFCIFTDDVKKVSDFLWGNQEFLPKYSVCEVSDFSPGRASDIIFLLFHFPLPLLTKDQKKLILRIDYLSFDPLWVSRNETLHIHSSENHEIIEIIVSLLPFSAWVLAPIPSVLTRQEFLWKLHLPKELLQKKWISLFCYEALFSRFGFSSLSPETVIFTFSKYEWKNTNIITLPFLSIWDYHSMLSLSDANIVRGEVSAVTAMQIKKPFFWDMYKEKWGFPQEMSDYFLEFFRASNAYRNIHKNINTHIEKIPFSKIENILFGTSSSLIFPLQNPPILIDSIENHIDRFYFSL